MSKDLGQASLLLEESEIRKNQRQRVQKIFRKRWIICLTLSFILIVVFVITSSIQIRKYKTDIQTLLLTKNQIQELQHKLSYQEVNKTIHFKQQSGLSKIKIMSQKDYSTTSAAIRHLNIQNTSLKVINGIQIPTVTSIDLPSSIMTILNLNVGIESLDFGVYNDLESISASKLNKIQKLQIQTTSMFFFSQMNLVSLKQLSIKSKQNFICDVFAPSLERLTINGPQKMISVVIRGGNHLNQIICNNCFVEKLYINTGNIRNIENLSNFKNLQIIGSPIQSLGDKQFPNLQKITLQNTSMKHFKINAPKLISISIQQSPLETFQYTHDTANKIPPSIQLVNTSITSVSNLNQSFKTLIFKNNLEMTLFSNNSLSYTTEIYFMVHSLISFNYNLLSNLTKVVFLQVELTLPSKLEQFVGNNLTSLKELFLQKNKIKVVRGNDFRSMKFLNLSNNNLNDSQVEALVKQNFWNITELKSVDLRRNNISSKESALDLLRNAFPDTLIYI